MPDYIVDEKMIGEWCKKYHDQAKREGWIITNNSQDEYCISKIDDPPEWILDDGSRLDYTEPKFKSDDEAVDYVMARAREGSEMHGLAWAIEAEQLTQEASSNGQYGWYDYDQEKFIGETYGTYAEAVDALDDRMTHISVRRIGEAEFPSVDLGNVNLDDFMKQREWLASLPSCPESEGLMGFLDYIADQIVYEDSPSKFVRWNEERIRRAMNNLGVKIHGEEG